MGTLGRSTALADGSGGECSGAARFESVEEKLTRRAAIDDSGGTRVGSGGSGGELVRSFVELVKTVEAKVSVGMSFGELDTCMWRLRGGGSESVGEMESGLGDEERKEVSVGSDANVGDEENANSCNVNKDDDDAGVNNGVEENGNSCDVTKDGDSAVNNGAGENGNSCDVNKDDESAVNNGVEENGNSCDGTKADSGLNDGVEENGNACDEAEIDSCVNNGVEENGKSLDEIGESEVIEDPVVGTSENGEDQVGEELGDGVYEFCIGDFVWGKIKNHPWWPGQICDPADASEHAAKLKCKDKLLVAYFGDETFAWCHPSQLIPFEENFVEKSKLSSSKLFVIAVQQAVDEIGRLVKLKMSCGCMGKEFLSGINRPLASNAGVKDGVVVPEGRVGKFVDHLSEPVDLLAELKHIAQVASLTNVLELNVLKSLLSSFYCLKGGYQLPVYIEPQLIPGLEDERKMVEAPVQWPSDDRLSSPVDSNTGNAEQSVLQKSPQSIENRQPHKRKEKSIADLLEEANAVEANSTDVSGKRGQSSRRKKQKSTDIHGEGILTSESGKERPKLSKSPISTKKAPLARKKKQDEGIGNDSSHSFAKESAGEKEDSKKTPLSRRRKRDECISIKSNDSDAQLKPGGGDTKKAPLSRRKKNENIHIKSNDSEAKGIAGAGVGELPNVGSQTDMKDQVVKGSLLRERKKSKYLSPPFTISETGKRKPSLETESPVAVTSHDSGTEGKEQDTEAVLYPEASSKTQFGERMTRAAANLMGSPQVLNSCSEALQEKHLIDGDNDGTDVKTPAEGEKKRIDLMTANTTPSEVLSGVLSASVDPLYQVTSESSFENVVDFVSTFRDSVYHNGCYSKLYKKQQRLGKRKKPDSETTDKQTTVNLHEGKSVKRDSEKQVLKSGKRTKKQAGETRSSKRRMLNSVIKSLGKNNEFAKNLPVSGRGQKNINNDQDKPNEKPASEPPIAKLVRRRSKKNAEGCGLKIKETQEEVSPTSIFVTFGPGSSLPTKDDLLSIYSKFGELDETETEMFYANFCARVAFVKSSDAEEAFNHSQIHSPFGASHVNFRLQIPSGSSKIRELNELPESPPAKKSRGKTASKALVVSQTPTGEPSQVGIIRHKLETISSMLGNSDRKVSQVVTSELRNEINNLLQVVSTMGESSS